MRSIRSALLLLSVILPSLAIPACGRSSRDTTGEPTDTRAPTATVTAVPSRTPLPTPAPTAQPAGQARVAAQVVQVIDGDTIEVWFEVPVEEPGAGYAIVMEPAIVRYIGVDAPDSDHPRASAATEANRQLLQGAANHPEGGGSATTVQPEPTEPPQLIVYLEKDVSEADEQGRLLRYVFLQDGRCVNVELVRQGHARAVSSPPDTRLDAIPLRAQNEAQAAGVGLWGPMPVRVTEVIDGDTIAVERFVGHSPGAWDWQHPSHRVHMGSVAQTRPQGWRWPGLL